MGRIANKKTGKLNKPYRDPSVYHYTRRGRKPKLWKKSTKKKRAYPNRSTVNNTTPQNLSPRETKLGCLIIFVLAILVIAIILIFSNMKESSLVTISLEELSSSNHPQAADDNDSIKAYYNDFTGVEFDHLSDFEYKYDGVLVWYYTSQYGDDSLNNILIDFSKLSVEEQKQVSFEKVLNVAMSFVPIEEVLEYYIFDKAIYVQRKDHIAHELYYKENKEKFGNFPSKFSQNHGFSIVIKEYQDGKFTVAIGTSWYDSEYDRDSIFNGHITQEELDAHKSWDFSLEKYKKEK